MDEKNRETSNYERLHENVKTKEPVRLRRTWLPPSGIIRRL